MITVYSDDHRLHHGDQELTAQGFVPLYEVPRRADIIRERIEQVSLGPIMPPTFHGLDPVLAVHDEGLVTFLSTAAERWAALGRSGGALPFAWPYRRTAGLVPKGLDGQLGYYVFDVTVPITPTTWTAVTAAVDVALTGVDQLLGGERAVFSLCRPPGHHAGRDYLGGYCFLNNAAITVQVLSEQGRVAVLDIDYHHGNGTQDIFYERGDVLFTSIHADPNVEFPYFTGSASETGAGPGRGTTLNCPLPLGTEIAAFMRAVERCVDAITQFAPSTLVVSLGVDTFVDDPISSFALQRGDYPALGRAIAALDLPTLYVMEGGYALEAIGSNTVDLLSGHDGA